MMPELSMAASLGAVGKATHPRPHGRLGRRLHRGGRVVAGEIRHPQACPRGGLGEAVGVERHVGVVDPRPLHHAGRRRRGWLLRAACPRLHPPVGRTRAHRRDRSRPRTGATGRRTRSPTCIRPDITVESVMASQMLWDPIRYDETCPSSDGACAVVIGDEKSADDAVAAGTPGRVDPRHRDAHRAARLRAPQRGQPAGRSRCLRRSLARRRCHRSPRRGRRRRDLRALLVVRADWLENLGSRRRTRAGS